MQCPTAIAQFRAHVLARVVVTVATHCFQHVCQSNIVVGAAVCAYNQVWRHLWFNAPLR